MLKRCATLCLCENNELHPRLGDNTRYDSILCGYDSIRFQSYHCKARFCSLFSDSAQQQHKFLMQRTTPTATATATAIDTKQTSIWKRVLAVAALENSNLLTQRAHDLFFGALRALVKDNSTDNKVDKAKCRKLKCAAERCVRNNDPREAYRFVRRVCKQRYALAVQHVKPKLKPRQVHIMPNSRHDQYLEIMYETAKSSLSGKGNAPSTA